MGLGSQVGLILGAILIRIGFWGIFGFVRKFGLRGILTLDFGVVLKFGLRGLTLDFGVESKLGL